MIRDYYKKWLGDQNYSDKTIKTYVSELDNVLGKLLPNEEKLNKSLLDYTFEDSDEVLNIISKIRDTKEYKKINEVGHHSLHSAIKHLNNCLDPFYYSIKISRAEDTEVVNQIINNEKGIEITNLNQYKDELRIGDIIFMNCVGDKVSWEKGLAGVATISSKPYDEEGRAFKIKVDMIYSFKSPMTRDSFIQYLNSYNAADIGPSTKGSQNQALKRITEEQTAAIFRAIFDNIEGSDNKINNFLLPKLTKKIQGPMPVAIIEKAKLMEGKKIPFIPGGYNEIYYGTPGCGKSYKVNEEYCRKNLNNVVRTTFHPDYSNSDFIGQIIPITNDESQIEYLFQPGPFTSALELSLTNPTEEIYLIIEEINRGNASEIFGEIFQLLDRDECGKSIYFVNNIQITNYLKKKYDIDLTDIYIPSNLWIIGTMNTSDQNVYTLDTAFKRRWRMKRISNVFEHEHPYKNYFIPGTHVTWETFVTSVNMKIINNNFGGFNAEDKQLGVYFVSKNELEKNENMSATNAVELFSEKVFMYLWEDVAKLARAEWFGECKSLDELITNFKEIGLSIFKDAQDLFDNEETK